MKLQSFKYCKTESSLEINAYRIKLVARKCRDAEIREIKAIDEEL
jgi:hypothetical protein